MRFSGILSSQKALLIPINIVDAIVHGHQYSIEINYTCSRVHVNIFDKVHTDVTTLSLTDVDRFEITMVSIRTEKGVL